MENIKVLQQQIQQAKADLAKQRQEINKKKATLLRNRFAGILYD